VLATEEFNDSYLYDTDQAHVYRPKNKDKQPKAIVRGVIDTLPRADDFNT
jgi:precorrin-4/cobalt-precorrin-4 C11-methyltransferase